MKKFFIMTLFLISALSFAQERNERKLMRDMTPEQVATLQTKKMTLALDLTEAQQSQMQTLHLKAAKERKAKMEKRKAAKEAEEWKKPTADEHYAMASARLDAQIVQKAKIKEVLSDEQYAKWEKMHHGKRKHHRSEKGQSSRKGK